MEKTQEQIDKINDQQNDKRFHPYTCCGPSEIAECKRNLSYKERREGKKVEFSNENEGALIATKEGFVCPCGKYTQPYRF